MSKKSKNKKRKHSIDDAPPQPSSSHNLLHDKLQAFLLTLTPTERDSFFAEVVSPERRAELWMQQAELGESLVNDYAWAIPDERALRILRHMAPLIEIGCGANAYWCQMLEGVDIIGYDVNPQQGGQIGDGTTRSFVAQPGGPEVLTEHPQRNLFLCYPDETVLQSEDGEETSLGALCLEHFQGEYVVHVGELYGDTLSMDQAPWGRSSGASFQERLAAEYHCVLQVALPNWLHVRDTLSVWKRSTTCSIVFAAEDDEDEDEEVEYKHIPIDEQLPIDRAAPCMQHLLEEVSAMSPTGNEKSSPPQKKTPQSPIVADAPTETTAKTSMPVDTASSKKHKRKKKKAKLTETSASTGRNETSKTPDKVTDAYECPW